MRRNQATTDNGSAESPAGIGRRLSAGRCRNASDQAKLQALTPQQRLVVADALAFFPQLTLDEILSELSLLA